MTTIQMESFKHCLINFNHKPKKYSSLFFRLPEFISDNIISWGFDNIPNNDIFFDANDLNFGREDEIHVTINYNLQSNIKEISYFLCMEQNFNCKLGEISVFTTNPKFDVLIIKVESDDLKKLNHKMKKELDIVENHSVYIPHTTIGYLKKGSGNNYIGDKTFNGIEFNVKNVVYSEITGQKTLIKLR